MRRAVELPARIYWQGHEYSGQTENISPGGALLNARVPPAAKVLLADISLQTGKAVRVRANVRWQRPFPPGIGVEFSAFLDPAEPE